MKNILNQIKTNSLKPVYLIFGEEGKLREDIALKLRTAAMGENGLYDRFEEAADPADIVNCANTLSLFGGSRLIYVKDSGFFTFDERKTDEGKGEGSEDDVVKGSEKILADYVKDPNPSAVIVFNEKKADKRSKLYKAVSKYGYALECKKPSAKDVKSYVVNTVKTENKRFDIGALDMLMSELDDDMAQAENELEKLICYTGEENVITRTAIEAVTSRKLESRIFMLTDAICRREPTKALDIFSNMMLMKESPIAVVISVSRQFRLMLQYKYLIKSMSHGDVVKRLGVHPYTMSKISACCRSFKNRTILAALKDCRDLLKAAFSGDMDIEKGIEVFILKYCSNERRIKT